MALAFVGNVIGAVEPWPAAVWTDPDLQARAVADPAVLGAALNSAGFAAMPLSTADLTNPAKLDPAKLRLLVLPYGGCYPAAGFDALNRYVRAGGGYIAFGGERFQDLLFAVNNHWLPLDATISPPAATAPRVTWDLKNHGEGVPLTVAGGGSTASPFHFEATEVKSSMYAGMKPGPLPERGAVIVFEARGGKATPFLCLELQEQDGSRWKLIVELSPAWREYRIHTASFVSYATPGRTNDYFRPAKTKVLLFGLFKQLAGGGPHEFDLRNIRFSAASVPAEVAFNAGVPLPGRELTAQFFGKQLPPPPTKQWPDYFRDGSKFTATSLKSVGEHPLTTGIKDIPTAFEGRLLIHKSPEVHDSAGDLIQLFPETASAPRFIPLLEAQDATRDSLGPVAGLVIHRTGRYIGSGWATFGFDKLDLAAASQQPLRDLFVRVAGYLAERVVIEAAPPTFTMREGQPEVKFTQSLHNRSPRAVTISVTGTLTQTNTPAVEAAKTVALPSSGSSTVTWHTAALEGFDWRAFRVQTDVASERGPLDCISFSVDAREALRDLCNFLVERARTTGKFSGTHYYIDHRGARTLLAAYEIFGDQRYLDTALAWGRAMVAEQRPDGGYRMGYGTTSRGEACFVADGGEIALGVARVAAYAAVADREKFLASLRAFMSFRDSFRCAGGGIGVGWCFTDYGKRPTVPLKELTKIFAPELNSYTIGCSLGAAYVWASLTGRAEDMQSARQDADWFMARAKTLSGASVESFVLAHALETDAAQRRRYEEFLRGHFIEPMATNTTAWWLAKGGRASLNLQALSYCQQRLGRDPRLTLQMARATSAMFAKESPTSIYQLLGKSKLNHDEWIYLCFGGIGLAEVVEPMTTFKRLDGRVAAKSK